MKARIDPRIDGARVQYLLDHQPLSASELARRAKISRQHLCRIRTKGADASVKVQKALACELGVPVEEIQLRSA